MKEMILSLLITFLVTVAPAQPRYDYREAFEPGFYPQAGNEFRSAGGMPGPKYWQNRADYKIACTLDTLAHTVSGTVEITYTNNSPDEISFLWLHLDQNINREDSRGAATATQPLGDGTVAEFTEGIVMYSITVDAGGRQYTPRSLVSDTRLQVWLRKPLKAAGGKVKLHISYGFAVPGGSRRMGRLQTRHGMIYQVAQWFPRMAVYDDIQGWDTLPFFGEGEFYLEYGDIEYSVTAPSDLIVVGSGELQNQKQALTKAQQKRLAAARLSDSTVMLRTAEEAANPAPWPAGADRTWRFKMHSTRDAAWAASRAFVWDAARINLPGGKKALAMSAYPVESIRKDGWQRSTEMVKAIVEYYSAALYEYPYPVATNVAGAVDGMEYPGIAFCRPGAAGAGLVGVTAHEFGHTWFPMVVGSNERRHAWMDEGFTSFTIKPAAKAFNKGEFAAVFSSLPIDLVTATVFNEGMDRMMTRPDVGKHDAYGKPSLMLEALREVVLGPERFDAAFKEYIRRWAFKHPTPWDFFRTMENVAGEDLSWFWRGWVLDNWRLDQAVKGVKYLNDRPESGAAVTIENLDRMVMPVEVLVKESNGRAHRLHLPVEVWQRGPEYTFTVPTSSMVTDVILDPDEKLLDINRQNNHLEQQ